MNNSSAISAISWREQVTFQWYDDPNDVGFVVVQHASSLIQQSTSRHFSPLGRILLIQSQLAIVFTLLNVYRRSSKYPFYKSLVWSTRGSNPRFTAPPMMLTPKAMHFQQNHDNMDCTKGFLCHYVIMTCIVILQYVPLS